MKKMMVLGAIAVLCLTACGGGDGGSATVQPTAKPLTISMYGKPLVSASSAAVAHAQTTTAIARADAASAASSTSTTTSDAQATVLAIQAALTARGITSNVSAQVMDGTTLHQIVMGENNGLPPTPDQFKTDPSEWMIVNFQFDDMVTPVSDPAQQTAVNQFVQDLTVFAQRAAVSGKLVYAVLPIQTCDNKYSAAIGVAMAVARARTNGAPVQLIGQIPFTISFDTSGNAVPSPDLAHLGTDCRTPDAYLENMRVQSIADSIAAGYKDSLAAASGTVAASAPSGASGSGT